MPSLEIKRVFLPLFFHHLRVPLPMVSWSTNPTASHLLTLLLPTPGSGVGCALHCTGDTESQRLVKTSQIPKSHPNTSHTALVIHVADLINFFFFYHSCWPQANLLSRWCLSTSTSIHLETSAGMQLPPQHAPWAVSMQTLKQGTFQNFFCSSLPIFCSRTAPECCGPAAGRCRARIQLSIAQHRGAAGGCGAPGGLQPAAGCLGMPPSPAPSPRTRPPGGAVAVPAMLGDGRGVRGPEMRVEHAGMSGWNRARGNGVLRCAEREAVPSPTSGLLQSVLQLKQTAVPHPPHFPAWPSVCRGRVPSSPRRWLCSGRRSSGLQDRLCADEW